MNRPENPDHYKGSEGITCLDSIRNMMTPDEYRGFIWGNITKYLWRWPKKGKLIDLKKAKWLIERLIETEEKKDAAEGKNNELHGNKKEES